MEEKRVANGLIKETSPYLLQHAYNPVNWLPFGEEAFGLAREQNKPLLISIGYSACHWCHVMEHESFEDSGVAEVMNRHFINVKVDREERTDVDMLYMQAVQLMTGHGGWPLNCFVLPDGRPFYGGTYFAKAQWLQLIQNLSALYQEQPDKVEEYAQKLTEGIKQSELLAVSDKSGGNVPDRELIKDCVAKWRQRLDNREGGPNRAPKFPMPSNYQFLLRYSVLEKDDAMLKHVELTLSKMAFGGIYDQLHGGFCRYSTDMLWKVPHFEKMLYDNSQLASLYTEAFLFTGNTLYRKTALDILAFVEREWYREGYFFSAYDADSEGVEGKFYVWSEEELKSLLGEDFDLFRKYYHIDDMGYWEDGNYILMRRFDVTESVGVSGSTGSRTEEVFAACREKLRQAAAGRVKPGLDDKTICAWNALMCKAYAQAYLAFGRERHKEIALRSAVFLRDTMMKDGTVCRSFKNGQVKIPGFLDDYAFLVEAFYYCYLLTADEEWLLRGKKLLESALAEFANKENEFLYYTSAGASSLVARTTEVSDNVIPASNSQMAINLYYFGKLFVVQDWTERAEKMLSKLLEDIRAYGAGYSNWACLALHFAYPSREVVLVGKNVEEKFRELYHRGISNSIFAVYPGPSDMPLAQQRYVEDQTLIYVCENNTCQLPVSSVEEAVKLLA